MSVALYTNLILILMSILLMMMVPLFRQPIPLHELAQIKTHTMVITPIVITINKTGEYQLNTEIEKEQSMTLDTIKKSLNKQFKLMDPTQTSICIKSDPNIPYGKIIEIVDWLQNQGAQHIGLLTTSFDLSQPLS